MTHRAAPAPDLEEQHHKVDGGVGQGLELRQEDGVVAERLQGHLVQHSVEDAADDHCQ